jgi:hypothetical protein
MSDVLEQFERKTKRHSDAAASEDARVYEAFKSVDGRHVRLRVHPRSQAWERLPYRFLLRIMEKSDKGTDLTLVFTFLAVVIKGSNLRAVADAIDREKCVFVQEFDPVRFDKPTDDKAAFIEKITIHAAPMAGVRATKEMVEA